VAAINLDEYSCARILAILLAGLSLFLSFGGTARAQDNLAGVHEGVASCGGSACHGRLVASGKTVRQNELITWQDKSSAAGEHSRAWQVLTGARADAITARLGLGRARDAGACLGCHAETPAQRGNLFQVSDGVGCEACHGGSGAWLASHYAVGASHAANVLRGMVALENPKTRAALCLDCHFGSAKPGQFVTHQMMAAGHPRISFELDLFSALQKHYDINSSYAKRKQVFSGMKFWSVGQALAVERALTLYGDAAHGQQGAFPEFYFFDCQSCHRRISEDPNAKLTAEANPARPLPAGTPPFDDENMIMLSAVARVAAPDLAGQFDENARGFHAALAKDRDSAVAAAARLAASARALSDAFAAHNFSRADTIAVLEIVLGDSAGRYTDYAGAAQAVMATDTLLNSLLAAGQVNRKDADAVRPQITRLYADVRDPNSWQPAEFRATMQQVAAAVRGFN
jgi:hypothetical protein